MKFSMVDRTIGWLIHKFPAKQELMLDMWGSTVALKACTLWQITSLPENSLKQLSQQVFR
jgi:hypothetical protein